MGLSSAAALAGTSQTGTPQVCASLTGQGNHPARTRTRPAPTSTRTRPAPTSTRTASPAPRKPSTRSPHPAPRGREALREDLLSRVLLGPDPDSRELGPFLAEDRAILTAEYGPPPPGFDPMADPGSAPPDGADSWLALLPAPLLEEYRQATTIPVCPELRKAGFWDRSSGDGTGFAAGGVADRMVPGSVLARFAEDASAQGLGELSDDELIGMLRCARRLASWAAALEHSAAADLMRRRLAEEADGDTGVAEHATDEIAAALTLTNRSADALMDRAMALRRLPATMRALSAGDIDLPRAAVIAEETTGLDDFHAAIVDQVIAHEARDQTTGQLRAATRRAVMAADPAAARARKERAQRDARVERWSEPAGTSALAGRDLPPAEVLAADRHISALARELHLAGVPGSMDTLRAHVFLALLAGRDLGAQQHAGRIPSPQHTGSGHAPQPAVPGPADQPAGHGHAPQPTHPERPSQPVGPAGQFPRPGASPQPTQPISGHRSERAGRASTGHSGIRGMVNLTMPLTTWLGLSEAPGEVAGYGPLDAADSRDLAAQVSGDPRSRWCLTLTDAAGHSLVHGCARAGPADPLPAGPTATLHADAAAAAIAWLGRIPLEELETGQCSHRHQSARYRPPPSLRHLIQVRHSTCTFPGCRRPAARCDLDHTLAWQQGGRTCLCDLAPLCRRHHRAKQTHGWRLEQPQPGVLVWTLPGGRSYTVRPAVYHSE